jgi:hypothetical protein
MVAGKRPTSFAGLTRAGGSGANVVAVFAEVLGAEFVVFDATLCHGLLDGAELGYVDGGQHAAGRLRTRTSKKIRECYITA